MKLTIEFYSEKGVHREKYDCGRSSKSRVGPRPLSMSQAITFDGLRDRIDLRWKKEVARRIRSCRHFQGDQCKVYITHPDLDRAIRMSRAKGEFDPTKAEEDVRRVKMDIRNPEDFSNKLGNYILVQTKSLHRGNFGSVKQEDAVAMVKLLQHKVKKKPNIK